MAGMKLSLLARPRSIHPHLPQFAPESNSNCVSLL
jgi:hypothetical protein